MANILMSYGFEDTKVGYIQGMNMILSGIIYHVKEEIKSYAVFRKLIFTIRTIYFNGKNVVIEVLRNATNISIRSVLMSTPTSTIYTKCLKN